VTFTLSPPVRIAALVALAAAALLGGGMMMLGRGGSSEPAPHVINRHPFGTHATAKHGAIVPVAVTKKHAATAKTKAHRPTRAAAAREAARRAQEQKAAIAAAIAAGLPAPIAGALGQHHVVVVSLYDPYSQVDGTAFAEARAGAALAGAGFVPLNVLSKAQVGKLTEQLGLMPDPGLLVYVRPATLVVKIGGFVDKETVAQAAQNAAHQT
jgi:hypothetical protein